MVKKKTKTEKPKQDITAQYMLRQIKPLTDNQKLVFDAYETDKNLLLHGSAGTGKSFLSTYLSLKEILRNHNDIDYPFRQLRIIRSIVPSRDPGFLPGSLAEKTRIYEEPYYEIVNDLFENGSAYDALKSKGLLDFQTTSFLRGTTFRNCIVLADEIQNMTWQELNTLVTRAGENCKMIFCGDCLQTDFTKEGDQSAILSFINIADRMKKSFSHIEFGVSDIVRSDFVRDFIIASNNYFKDKRS